MKETELVKELKNIRQEIHEIKSKMVDIDKILSQDDYDSLIETVKEKKTGKLVSLNEIMKDLGCM